MLVLSFLIITIPCPTAAEQLQAHSVLPTGISQARGIVTLKAEFGAWLPLSFSSSQNGMPGSSAVF